MSKNSCSLYQNTIKITPKGKYILMNLETQAVSSINTSQTSSTKEKFFPMLSKKNIEHMPTEMGVHQSFLAKKAKKEYFLWLKNREQIKELIEKEIEKRQKQNSKEFDWEGVSSHYKENANIILEKWDRSQKEEKKRIKERLKGIYNKKYRQDENKFKRKGSEQRRIFHSQKNYGKKIDFI